MLNFTFDAQAYKDSLQHELIPEGQYRARIISVSTRNMPDGSTILTIEYQVTYKNFKFKDTLFLNPAGHPYHASSNRKFGDMCNSFRANPFEIIKDENKLIGCAGGIELAHKKSKDGNAIYNSVKKFLTPDETERLKEFSAPSTSSSSNTTAPVHDVQNNSGPADPRTLGNNAAPIVENTALDISDPSSWF